MLNKLLNNHWAVIGILAVLLTVVMVGISIVPSTTDIPSYNSTDTLAYQNVKKDIEAFKQATKWTRTDYYRILESIEYCAKNNLIDVEEQTNLKKQVENQYLSQLKDTVQGFCVWGTESTLSILEKEVKPFLNTHADKVSVIDTHLKNYRTVLNACQEIASYTAQSEYSDFRSKALEVAAKNYLTYEFISDNKFIEKKVENAVKRLKRHKYFASTYEDESKRGKDNCDCSKVFEGYSFYVEKCKEIQQNL